MLTTSRYLCALACCCLAATVSTAHPVLKDSHDRTIVVRLQKGETPSQLRLRVDYRLELLEWTVYENDMKPFRDEVPKGLPPMEFYAHFARKFAPIFANHLVLQIDKGEAVKFRCLPHKETLHDED